MKLPDIVHQIEQALYKICPDTKCGVAVRSSAFDEDLTSSAAAGLYQSMFCPSEPITVLKNLVSVSIQRSQAAALCPADVKHPVLIQRLITATASGVCFSRDFRNTLLNICLLEASFGLGTAVVEGRVIPDRWIIRGADLADLSFSPGLKDEITFFDTATGRIRHRRNYRPMDPVLTTAQVYEIAKLARRCEDELGHAVDVEWAIDSEGGLFLLQARPITALYSG